MKIAVSSFKADVGSIGGHTKPTKEMLDFVREEVAKQMKVPPKSFLIFHCGDDIAIVLVHQNGINNKEIHDKAFNILKGAGDIAKEQGLYAFGQDILKDAPSGNVRGTGIGFAEMEFEKRIAEAMVVIATDKTNAGAISYNLFKAFSDPDFCSGLILSKEIHKGFTFEIIDSQTDKLVELNTPEDIYEITALIRDDNRFFIRHIHSRSTGEIAATSSVERLQKIAGRYKGKDDPIALARCQQIFPATEEMVSPFTVAAYVSGNTRGSHHMPLAPVPVNTPASSSYCVPLVSVQAISINDKLEIQSNDIFADPYWDAIRQKAYQKAILMREQGYFGAAMVGYEELEYGGIVDILKRIEGKFTNEKPN